MKRQVESSPKSGFPVDNDDAKYVSGLSTVLVATIQEAKDRISQIEDIFCSQLFPSFQFQSKCLERIYSEARKSAEDAWKNKETDLLRKREELEREKQKALHENTFLKHEKTRILKEHEEKIDQLQSKLTGEQVKVKELTRGLMLKSEEIDEEVEVQRQLLQMVRSKVSLIISKEQQLKEQEEKINDLLTKLSSLENVVKELHQELKEKTEVVVKRKDLEEKLLKTIDLQASEIVNCKQLISDQQNEKQLLTSKMEELEENVLELKKELCEQNEQVEEARKSQKQWLLQQIDSSGMESLENKAKLEECEKEKKLLVTKMNYLQEKVNELQSNLRERHDEVAECSKKYEKLSQQIESISLELLAEQKKRMDAIEAYKRLKSQHIFLRRKFGLTTESMLTENETLDQTDPSKHKRHRTSSPELENQIPDTSLALPDKEEVKKEITACYNSLENGKGIKVIQASVSHCTPNVKLAPLAGIKKPSSCWRDTRSNQAQIGPDPHDDFLGTPFENARENLNKAVKDKVHDPPTMVSKDMAVDISDDETQDLSTDSQPGGKQQISVPVAVNGGFKFVEPVRKKADRENLKGIECKQCKKFYDAVLPDDENTEAGDNKRSLRCEHHEGVSRHRYRYAPPMTPEGFWNIGFESEM